MTASDNHGASKQRPQPLTVMAGVDAALEKKRSPQTQEIVFVRGYSNLD